MTANVDMLQKMNVVTRVCSIASGYVLGALQALNVTDFVLAQLNIKNESQVLAPALWGAVVVATISFTAEVLVLRGLDNSQKKTEDQPSQTHQEFVAMGVIGLAASVFSQMAGQVAGASAYAVGRGISLLCSVPTLILAHADVAKVREKGYQESEVVQGFRSLFASAPVAAKVN